MYGDQLRAESEWLKENCADCDGSTEKSAVDDIVRAMQFELLMKEVAW